MTFDEWKEKHSDLIENVAITFFYYGRGVDTKTCYDELEYLLKKAFNAGKPKWHNLNKNYKDLPNEGEWVEGVYQIGMASEIDKRERVIVEAKEIIRDLIFDLVAIDGEQAEGLDSVKKAKQFFREMKENV